MNPTRTQVPPAAIAGAVVIAVSLVGGALAVAGHVNTAAEAFSSKAELAAPWPMLVLQFLGAVGIARWRDWRGIAGAAAIALTGLLGLASISDDETFKAGLPTWAYAMQVLIIAVSAAAVVPCAMHVRRLARARTPAG